MLQNTRVTAFTVCEFLRENQLGEGGGKITPLPLAIQIRVKVLSYKLYYSNTCSSSKLNGTYQNCTDSFLYKLYYFSKLLREN